MSTLIHPSIQQTLVYTERKTSLWQRFLTWCSGQEEDRLLWLGVALAGHGCVLAPLAIYVVVATGFSFALFMATLIAMTLALVVNLAALPTRVTIPVLVASAVVDVIVIAAALLMV